MRTHSLKPLIPVAFLFVILSVVLSACDTASAQELEVVTIDIEKATATPGGDPSFTPEAISTIPAETALELADLGWISYTASEGGRRDVWLIRPDGSDETNLTGGLVNTFAEAPVWSPDGKTIAFDGVPNSDVLRDVYLVTVGNNPQQRPLTTLSGFDCYPSFSPDGTQIVYMSERDGNRDLFIMDLEGNDVRQLTDSPAYDYEPNWAPDGEHIAYVSRSSGNSEIYVMDVDGGNVVQLTENPALDWRPVWSPDGKWIVFESWRTGNGDVYIMRANGTQMHRLTTSEAEDGNPNFSPDGRFIVFHSQRTGNYQLFILEVADPENQWHLDTGSVRALLPVWSPVTEIPDVSALAN